MLTFLAPWFALLGVLAAAGPILIHLLNRRRYRVVNWAAMDFLVKALERNRKLLQWRDLLLMLLRTVCVLLYCLAMARPYWTSAEAPPPVGELLAASGAALAGVLCFVWALFRVFSAHDPRSAGAKRPLWTTSLLVLLGTGLVFGASYQLFWKDRSADQAAPRPLHAILLVDNSLSMGYRTLDRTRLDRAKQRAKEFVDRLPLGSRIHVLPLCGSASRLSQDAYRTPEDALEALDQIEVVDRQANVAVALDLATEALKKEPELAPRIVLLSDQQALNWPKEGLGPELEKLPEMQVVAVGEDRPSNSWVADLRVQNGLADIETNTEFLAEVRYEGTEPRRNVQVNLEIGGQVVASQTINLEPNQSRELYFTHRFETIVEPGKPVFEAAAIALTPDDLPEDDRRVLSVPVVAALPVVCVDQLGADEDPSKNQYGETFYFRRLLVPVRERGDPSRQLVLLRHVKMDQVDRELLKDARLVIVAGVERPGPAAPVLRDYVLQGGQLLIAPGEQFNIPAWNAEAWDEGAGWLPAPLAEEAIGRLPSEPGGELRPFYLDFRSLVDDDFRIPGESPETLQDLYQTALFFKALQAERGPEVAKLAVQAEVKRREEERKLRAEAGAEKSRWAELEQKGKLTDADRQAQLSKQHLWEQTLPHWLLWKRPGEEAEAKLTAADWAERARPQLLASFTNSTPFLVERQIGRGHVLWIASGIAGSWSTLMTSSDAIVLFDRVARSRLQRTLPNYTYTGVEQIQLPLEPVDRRARFTLARPNEPAKDLLPDALGAETFGLTVDPVTQRGHYWLTARNSATAASADTAATVWKLPLAVNGPAAESQLTPITSAALQSRLGQAAVRWIGPDEAIRLEGAQITGQDYWSYLLVAVLVGLLAEMAVLAWSSQTPGAAS